MSAASVAAALRRRWVAVLVGIGLSALFALGLYARAERTTAFVATERVTLDTAPSQLTSSAPRGAETLAWRLLLARLLTSDAERSTIARAAGLRPDEVAVAEPSLAVPPVATALAEKGSAASQVTADRSVTLIVSQTLPVVRVVATSPSRGDAAALASATVGRLRDLAARESRAGVAQPLAVERAGVRRVRSERTRRDIVALTIAPVALLVGWCWLVVVADGFAGRLSRRPRAVV
jgi:hypothetical protein